MPMALNTAREGIITARTTRKKQTDQTTIVVKVANAMAAFIAGMIQIGPSSTIVAVICQNFLRESYRLLAKAGSSVQHMGPEPRSHMSPYHCWGSRLA